MSITEKNTAIQELMDMQQRLESLEADYAKANDEGRKMIDKNYDQILSTRRGMEIMLKALGVDFDRRNVLYRDINGETRLHTIWYLV